MKEHAVLCLYLTNGAEKYKKTSGKSTGHCTCTCTFTCTCRCRLTHSQRRKFLRVFQLLDKFFLLSLLSFFRCVRKFGGKLDLKSSPDQMDWTSIVIANCEQFQCNQGNQCKQRTAHEEECQRGQWCLAAPAQFSAEKQERTIAHEPCFGLTTALL